MNSPANPDKEKPVIKLKQTESEVLLESNNNEQMKSLNKAR